MIPDGWIFLMAFLGPITFWILFGMFAQFQDEKDRQDWLWGGLFTGIFMAILYLGLR